jgi:hypothetical protein
MASAAMRNSEVRAVDAFLLEPKRLVDGPPRWSQSEHRMREIHATWTIEDSLGARRAELRFRCFTRDRKHPSVSLIFRAHPIWRVDIVPPDECKYNPPWAAKLGLPATVCGPHGHEWPDNRDHLLNQNVTWNIPCRRPLPTGIRRLEQVLPWFAARVAIELLPDQRGFDVPPQDDLFS